MNHFSIFAKYWQPGAVKTRLIPAVGEYLATEYYRLFLEILGKRFRSEGDRRTLVYAPPSAESSFRTLAGSDWEIEPQVDGELGERLKSHFNRAFDQGAERVIVIGSDSPTLPRTYVEQAWQQLNGNTPVVLGRAEDGGYYLVGAYRSTPPIFDSIAWGTHLVFHQTTERLAEFQCPYATLPMWYDIDDFGDLKRFFSELETTTHSSELTEARAVFDKFNETFLWPKLPWPPQSH